MITSRRLDRRRKFSGGSGGAPPVTPLSIMGTSSVLQWCASYGGVTTSGGAVTQWADQTANALHYTSPGAAGTRPLLNTNSLNGNPGILFDGADDYLESSLALAAPGSTPVFIWGVLRQIGWTNTARVIADASASGLIIYQNASTPEMRLFNGTNGVVNNAGSIGTAGRFEALFNNATSDYFKFRATSVTGQNCGNTSGGTGRRIGRAFGANAFYSNVELFEIAYFNRKPNAGEFTSLDSYASAKWGAGVLS